MRLLWLCNIAPGAVKEKLYGSAANGGLWIDHVLSDLMTEDMELRILCPGKPGSGRLSSRCGFATFQEPCAYRYQPELEAEFQKELRAFQPDVIHIWGSEYGHTLAMVNAAEKEGKLPHTAISIQGLCSVYTRHYGEGVPWQVQRGYTLRDLLRRDNILSQQNKFRLRGELEKEALRKVRHVIGRTSWDYACTRAIGPQSRYHFCNETLREPFYQDTWDYAACRKHRVFASSCVYPIKGFHYLLEAMGDVIRQYPDASIAVPGRSFLPKSGKDRLRANSYENYLAKLAKQYHLESRIQFLGTLSAEQMKAEFLQANVFVLPSTVENSPNSLGEAMLLGVPCVASDVGGVAELMERSTEGRIYPVNAPYMLAHHIQAVFAMEDRAATLGQAARQHAMKTHDPERNREDLLQIYRELI